MENRMAFLAFTALALSTTTAASATFRDKTLVPWAAPANLTQQSGSALTTDVGPTHFDGIVFAELASETCAFSSDVFTLDTDLGLFSNRSVTRTLWCPPRVPGIAKGRGPR